MKSNVMSVLIPVLMSVPFYAHALQGYRIVKQGDSLVSIPDTIHRETIEIEEHDFVFTVTIDGEPWVGEVLEINGTDTLHCPCQNVGGGFSGSQVIKDRVLQKVKGALYYRTTYGYKVGKYFYTVEILLPLPDLRNYGISKCWKGIVDFRQFGERIQKRNLKACNALRYDFYQIGPCWRGYKSPIAKVIHVVDADAVGR